MIMYVIVGKQNCIQCDEFKNLLDEQGIQYNYLHITEMPNKTMTYLQNIDVCLVPTESMYSILF